MSGCSPQYRKIKNLKKIEFREFKKRQKEKKLEQQLINSAR